VPPFSPLKLIVKLAAYRLTVAIAKISQISNVAILTVESISIQKVQ